MTRPEIREMAGCGASSMNWNSMTERRYRSDDRDLEGCDNDLMALYNNC